jgi:murein DD-endopeptidase MepM/ murein hydrolase activator NlpD
MVKKTTSIIIALILLTLNLSASFAQESAGNPIYIVQPGENLTEIAYKFDVSVQEIISINGILDSNLISAGTELIIPGLEGVTGFLITYPVQIGESFQLLLRKYRLTTENFLKLNKLTSPAEIFVGTNLILPSINQNEQNPTGLFIISEVSSTFGQTVMHGQNRWFVKKYNETNFPFDIPGESIYYPSDDPTKLSSPFSPYIQSIELSPLPIVQGHTAVVKIASEIPVELTGEINSHELHFFIDPISQFYSALDGIHALEEPGLVDLKLNGVFENGEVFQVDQLVLLSSGGYIDESITVESTFIDKDLNIEESRKIDAILAPVTDEKLWNDTFRFPVDGSLSDHTIAFSSYFGNRRSYNSGQYFGFHGGLDFIVVLNSLNIYAPAPGIVIFAGPMDIRGNTTFIDHGQGVVSGYGHQIEILVEQGQRVETGQLIGKIGNTGRVTGPHLHWDIWVNGNQVDPFDWVENIYP